MVKIEIKDATQEQKIITQMVRVITRQDWFYPPDFMTPGSDLFVGYEASARLSGLVATYGDGDDGMFATRARGKYKERRIRYETIERWFERLPFELRSIFRAARVLPGERFDYKSAQLF